MAGARIAITGTPGVGKTTFSKSGEWNAISVQQLATQFECMDNVDSDGVIPIDIEKLSQAVIWPDGDLLLIDGHLSHLLPVDAAIIIRCEPNILEKRLEARGYSAEKINENVECELIGLITAECLGIPHLELNSADGIDSMIEDTKRWIADGFKPSQPSEPIDWIQEIHGDD